MASQQWTPQRVKALRKGLGMTQEQFAEAVGVAHLVVVSRWELGTRAPDRRSRAALERLESSAPRREKRQ